MSASPARVLELAHDVARWSEQLPHYRKVTIESRNGAKVTARMSAVRPVGPFGIPVSWTAEQWADDSDPTDLQLRFRHVAGVTRGMDVTWHIRAAAAGSRVTIEHVFSRRLPLIGTELLPRIMDRLFVRPIASRTLATFKRLAEAPA